MFETGLEPALKGPRKAREAPKLVGYMSMKAYYLGLFLVLSIGLAFGVHPVAAQNLTNLAGSWNGVYFSTPSRLTLMQSPAVFTNGPTHYSVVTNIFEAGAFGAGVFQVDFQSNGTFTGPGNGTIAIGTQGELTVSPDDGAAISFRVNAAQDVAAGIDQGTSSVMLGEAQINELNLILRAPATLSAADLAGDWSLKTFASPAGLSLEFAQNSIVPNVTPLVDIRGLDTNSVQNSSFGQIAEGTMTFATNGSVTGNLQGPLSGNFTVGSNGQISVNFPGDGFSETFFINASKNTMFALHQEQDNNRQEIIMLTKNPATVNLAAMQGLWKVTSFSIPSQLDVLRDGNNYITDIFGGSDFDIEQMSFSAGNDGFVTAMFEGVPTAGMLTSGTGGAVALTFTNALGHVEVHLANVNSAHDVMTLVNDELSAVVLTKSPNVATNRQDFGLIQFGTKLMWAAGSGRSLQSSASLDGTWTNVPGTTGQHEYQPQYTNTAAFFRVGQ